GAHYVRAQQVRALVRREVDEALAKRDVLLAPATPIAAPVLGERDVTLGDGPSDVRSALIRFTRPINFSGHPACAAPCGFTAGGPGVGDRVRVVAPPAARAGDVRAPGAGGGCWRSRDRWSHAAGNAHPLHGRGHQPTWPDPDSIRPADGQPEGGGDRARRERR